MITVLACGCFDVLHAGHVAHLEEARHYGTRLIVALTLDEAVNKGPGRPIHTWEERAAVLRALRSVDGVIPSRSATDAIEKVVPQVFVKGTDYRDDYANFAADRLVCERNSVRFILTHSAKMSSTEIVKRMRKVS